MIYCKKCNDVLKNQIDTKNQYRCKCNNVFSIMRNCYCYVSGDLSIDISVFYNGIIIYRPYKEIDLYSPDLFDNEDTIKSEIIYEKVFERMNKIIDNMIFE